MTNTTNTIFANATISLIEMVWSIKEHNSDYDLVNATQVISDNCCIVGGMTELNAQQLHSIGLSPCIDCFTVGIANTLCKCQQKQYLVHGERMTFDEMLCHAEVEIQCRSIDEGKKIEEATFRSNLDELLICYIDSDAISTEVATNLSNLSTSFEVLEEMLIACVDSETVSLETASFILDRLDSFKFSA